MLATVDDLTKLLNRRHFLESLKSEFSHAQQYDRPLSVLMIDADDFKRINDRHGHSAGDDVLRAMAERCRAAVRRSDLVGRAMGAVDDDLQLPEVEVVRKGALAELDIATRRVIDALRAADRLRRRAREIPIEQRSAEEVATMTGRTTDGRIETVRIVPEGSPVANYAFDVTPARLVTGLITERGVHSADRAVLSAAFPERIATAPE